MKAITILIFLIILNGCGIGPTFHIDVDSLRATTSVPGNKYILLPGNKGILKNDLQYQEFARYTNRALRLKGYHQSNNIHEADIAIVLEYGIGEPKTEHYTYSTPTWGQTGVSSSNTNARITAYNNTANYSATTTYTPTYGVTGSKTHSGTKVSYFRFMRLTALDTHEYKIMDRVVSVWETTVTSSGSSGDLRQVFPILVAASIPYIGGNTGKKVRVRITESDQQVDIIKGIQTK